MNINALPPTSHRQFGRLKRQADDAAALRDATHREIQLNEARCTATASAARSAGTDAGRAAAIQQLATLRDEHGQLVQERQRRDAVARSRMQLYLQCEAWVERQQSDTKWRTASVKIKGQLNAEHLAAKRRDIADLQFDLQRVAASPLDRQSIEALVARRVADWAASCRVTLTGERGDAPFDIGFDAHAGGLHRPHALETLAWWDPKGLTAKLLATIPEVEGISAADKAQATERLGALLLAAERDEEAQIEAAAAVGTTIERRVDADPRAVLGVAVVSAVAAQPMRSVA